MTLVELLIAMALGLFLVGVMLQLSTADKQTFEYQQSQSFLQENSRFAGYYLENILGRTGYISAPQNLRAAAFPAQVATPTCNAFAAGQVVSKGKFPAGSGNVGICIRYQRVQSGDTDCTGKVIATANAFVTRVYFDKDSSTPGTLVCAAQSDPAAQESSTQLIGNISDFKIAYGLSFGSELTGRSIDTYTPYGTDPANWAQVNSLRFAILSVSDDTKLYLNDTKQSYFFPLEQSSASAAQDQRLYRSYEKTVTLRNVVLM